MEDDDTSIPIGVQLLVAVNRLRRACFDLVRSTAFTAVSLAIITLNCIILTRHRFDGTRRELEIVNNCCTALFVVELFIRITAAGVTRFLTTPWELLDLVAITVSALAVLFPGVTGFADVSALRVLRWLLPINDGAGVPVALRIMTETLLRSFSGALDVICLGAVVVVLYAVAGMQVFSGVLSSAERWQNYNSLPDALVATLDTLLTGDWTLHWEKMLHLLPDAFPDRWVVIIFAISLATVGNYVVVALFLTVSASVYAEVAPVFIQQDEDKNHRVDDDSNNNNSNNNEASPLVKAKSNNKRWKPTRDAATWVNAPVDSVSAATSLRRPDVCDAVIRVPRQLSARNFSRWCEAKLAARQEVFDHMEDETNIDSAQANKTIGEKLTAWFTRLVVTDKDCERCAPQREGEEEEAGEDDDTESGAGDGPDDAPDEQRHQEIEMQPPSRRSKKRNKIKQEQQEQKNAATATAADKTKKKRELRLVPFLRSTIRRFLRTLLLHAVSELILLVVSATCTFILITDSDSDDVSDQLIVSSDEARVGNWRARIVYNSTWIFSFWMVARIFAFGFVASVEDIGWWLEVGITIRGILAAAFAVSERHFEITFSNVAIVEETLRVCFVLKFIELFPPLASACRAAFRSIRSTLYLCALTLLVTFVFSVIGFHLFGGAPVETGPTDELHFDTWLESFYLCFIVLTGDIVLPYFRWCMSVLPPLAHFVAFAFIFSLFLLGRGMIVNIVMCIAVEDVVCAQTAQEEQREQQIQEQLDLELVRAEQEAEEAADAEAELMQYGVFSVSEFAMSNTVNFFEPDGGHVDSPVRLEAAAGAANTAATPSSLTSAVAVRALGTAARRRDATTKFLLEQQRRLSSVTEFAISSWTAAMDYATCSIDNQMPALELPPAYIGGMRRLRSIGQNGGGTMLGTSESGTDLAGALDAALEEHMEQRQEQQAPQQEQNIATTAITTTPSPASSSTLTLLPPSLYDLTPAAWDIGKALTYLWHHPPLYPRHFFLIPNVDDGKPIRKLCLHVAVHPAFRWLASIACFANVVAFVTWPEFIVDEQSVRAHSSFVRSNVDAVRIFDLALNVFFVLELVVNCAAFGVFTPSANTFNEQDQFYRCGGIASFGSLERQQQQQQQQQQEGTTTTASPKAAIVASLDAASTISYVGYDVPACCDCHKEEAPPIKLAYLASDLFNLFDTIARATVFLSAVISWPALRYFRVFRSARLLTLLPEARNILIGFCRSFPVAVIRFAPVAAIIFVVLGIVGVQLFKGKLGKCVMVGGGDNNDGGEVVFANDISYLNKTACLAAGASMNSNTTTAAAGTAWVVRTFNYDDLRSSMLCLYIVSGYATTSNMLFNLWDAATHRHTAMSTGNSPLGPIFTVIVYFACTVFAANGFCGVLMAYLMEANKLSAAERRWPQEAREGLKIRSFLQSLVRETVELQPDPASPWSQRLHWIMTATWTERNGRQITGYMTVAPLSSFWSSSSSSSGGSGGSSSNTLESGIAPRSGASPSTAGSSSLSLFDVFVVSSIIANFVAFALVNDFDTQTVQTVNRICFVCFVVELVMKFIAYRRALTNPNHDAFYDFVTDLVVVTALLLSPPLLNVSNVFGMAAFLRVLKLRKIVGPRTGWLRLLDAMLQPNVRRNVAGALFVLLFGVFVFAVLGVVLFRGTVTPQLFEDGFMNAPILGPENINVTFLDVKQGVGWSTQWRNFNSVPAALKLVFDGASPDTYIGFVADLIGGYYPTAAADGSEDLNRLNNNLSLVAATSNSDLLFLGSLPEGMKQELSTNLQATATATAAIERNDPFVVSAFYVISYLLLGIVGPSFVGAIVFDVIVVGSVHEETQRDFLRTSAAWLRVTSSLTLPPQVFLDKVAQRLPSRMTGFASQYAEEAHAPRPPAAAMLRFLLNVPIPLIQNPAAVSSSNNSNNSSSGGGGIVTVAVSHDHVLGALAAWRLKLSPEMAAVVFGSSAFRVAAEHVASGDAMTLGHWYAAQVILRRWRATRSSPSSTAPPSPVAVRSE